MRKLTLRQKIWSSVALLAVFVLSVAGYLLTRSLPEPAPKAVRVERPRFDLRGEMERGKQLPEFAELNKLIAKENRPLSPEGMARAGELTTNGNVYIRMVALQALRYAPDALKPSAATLVAAGLHDENSFVRIEAMNELGMLKVKDYIPQLREFLNSADPDERTCAHRALRMIGDAPQ